jgi:putative endonuclease
LRERRPSAPFSFAANTANKKASSFPRRREPISGSFDMAGDFEPTVYILASHRNGTLYVGVTANLLARLHQHREGLIDGFTKDYGVTRLVWFEQHATMDSAILREKRLKKWNRAWKLRLIEEVNPDWDDLAVGLGFARLPSRRVD